MTLRDEVAAEQEQEFEAMGVSETVRALTKKVYDGIDSLNDERKRLLVGSALAKANEVIESATQSREMGPGLLMLARGLIAIAGYTTAGMAEDAGDTSTGDRTVDEILLTFRDLARETAGQHMSPEQRARAEALAERVNARVAAGEDVDAALAAERAAEAGRQLQTVQTNDKGEEGFGLYL